MGDLKPIFSYLKPYRRELAAAIILLLAECIFEMVIPLLMTDIVDVGVPNHDIGFLYRQGGLMALCAVLALVSGFLYARFAARADAVCEVACGLPRYYKGEGAAL